MFLKFLKYFPFNYYMIISNPPSLGSFALSLCLSWLCCWQFLRVIFIKFCFMKNYTYQFVLQQPDCVRSWIEYKQPNMLVFNVFLTVFSLSNVCPATGNSLTPIEILLVVIFCGYSANLLCNWICKYVRQLLVKLVFFETLIIVNNISATFTKACK